MPLREIQMANGATVRLIPKIPSTSAEAAAPTSAAETAIGVAVADATLILCRAMADHLQNGALSPATREAGGTRMARVSMLMLDHAPGDSDFITLAHQAGKRELRRHLDAALFRKHGVEEIDKALDGVIDSVFEIVSLAVRDERAIRAALAN
jgi:hypothetical protein